MRPEKEVPELIPPRSRVRLIRADRSTPSWKTMIGREFRIGYYNPQDGLKCIWLVDEMGKYEQTTDREALLRYFEILKLSNETDNFGTTKRRLGPIRRRTVNVS